MSRRVFAVQFAFGLAGILGFGTDGFADSPKQVESGPAFLRALGRPAVQTIESQVSVCRPQADAPWPGIKREFDFKMDLLLPPLEVENSPDWTPFACQVGWLGRSSVR